MSALAMILMAGMAVGDVPGKASEKVEQGLDLSGEWEGMFWDFEGKVYKAALYGDRLDLEGASETGWFLWEYRDEGQGRVKIDWLGDTYLGIYRNHGDSVDLSYCLASNGRPRSFKSGGDHFLLTLRRVKPRK